MAAHISHDMNWIASLVFHDWTVINGQFIFLFEMDWNFRNYDTRIMDHGGTGYLCSHVIWVGSSSNPSVCIFRKQYGRRIELDVMYIVLPLSRAHLTTAGKCVYYKATVDTGYFLNKKGLEWA